MPRSKTPKIPGALRVAVGEVHPSHFPLTVPTAATLRVDLIPHYEGRHPKREVDWTCWRIESPGKLHGYLRRVRTMVVRTTYRSLNTIKIEKVQETGWYVYGPEDDPKVDKACLCWVESTSRKGVLEGYFKRPVERNQQAYEVRKRALQAHLDMQNANTVQAASEESP